MNNRNDQTDKPQQQTPDNPSGSAISNPFENGQKADQEIELAKDELEKEQAFKEAQTERD
jgi:hypothetical protein